MKTEFTVVSTIDENIKESGIYDPDFPEPQPKLQWLDYGLKWFFPNNHYDPYMDTGRYNRHNQLQKDVLNDKELETILATNENATIHRDGYVLVIGNGNEICIDCKECIENEINYCVWSENELRLMIENENELMI